MLNNTPGNTPNNHISGENRRGEEREESEEREKGGNVVNNNGVNILTPLGVPEPDDPPPLEGEFGNLTGLTVSQRQTHARQTRFLTIFAHEGSIYKAGPMAGVDRQLVYYWQKHDYLGFNARCERAEHSFRERLQDEAIRRIYDPQGNRGSDVLNLALLNAHWPDRYKPGQIVVNDASKEVLTHLRQLTRRTVRTKGPLEPGDEAAVVATTETLSEIIQRGR